MTDAYDDANADIDGDPDVSVDATWEPAVGEPIELRCVIMEAAQGPRRSAGASVLPSKAQATVTAARMQGARQGDIFRVGSDAYRVGAVLPLLGRRILLELTGPV